MVTRFQQLENWGRHQVWWNSVKPQAWRQCLVFILVPAGSGALRPSTNISHADHVCSKHGMLECIQLPGNLTYHCQYVRYEVWSLPFWNKHSQIMNTWLHIHMITYKQIRSKYLFFLLHCTLHWKSNSFSSDGINIKYAYVFYFSDINYRIFYLHNASILHYGLYEAQRILNPMGTFTSIASYKLVTII